MNDKRNKDVKIRKAKGRPILTWVGKRPLSTVKAYPAQHVESFSATMKGFENYEAYQSDWPDKFEAGGLFRAQIDDWRAVVEGEYELDLPPDKTTVAVKIIDMLGEEIILTETP